MQPLLTHRQWTPPSVPRELDYSHPPFSQYLPFHGNQQPNAQRAPPPRPRHQQPSLPLSAPPSQIKSSPYSLPSAQDASSTSSIESGTNHSPWLLTPQYAFFPATTTVNPAQTLPPQHPPYTNLQNFTQPYPYPYPCPINTQPNNATANHADMSGIAETYTYTHPLTPTTHVSTSSWPKTIFNNSTHTHTYEHEANPFCHVDQSQGYMYNTHSDVDPSSFPISFAPPLYGIINYDQSNSITIPSGLNTETDHSNQHRIFRSENTASTEPSSTIDPSQLSTLPTGPGGGPRDQASNLNSETMNQSDRMPSSNFITSSVDDPTPIPINQDAKLGTGDRHHPTRIQQHSHAAPSTTSDDKSDRVGVDKPLVSRRGMRSSSSIARSSRTTPLRKKRPPKLHLPPPTNNMHLPIPPPLHSAPAAAFSLDILMPPTSGRPNQAVPLSAPQPPPKVNGWISPEERPVPPVGYTPIIQPAVPADQQEVSNTGVTMSMSMTLPCAPHDWIPQGTETIPRAIPDLQIRVPPMPEYPAPPSYLVAPGLNGFEIIPWRATPRFISIPAPLHLLQSNHIFPPVPATAALWDVSAPPPDDALPPPTASSSSSTDSWSDLIPITACTAPPAPVPAPANEGAEVMPEPSDRAHPVLRRHTSQTSARPFGGIENRQQTICEVCHTALSRQSDLVRHMRKHTGEKPYQCQHCGDTYARKDKLSNHITRVHTKSK